MANKDQVIVDAASTGAAVEHARKQCANYDRRPYFLRGNYRTFWFLCLPTPDGNSRRSPASAATSEPKKEVMVTVTPHSPADTPAPPAPAPMAAPPASMPRAGVSQIRDEPVTFLPPAGQVQRPAMGQYARPPGQQYAAAPPPASQYSPYAVPGPPPAPNYGQPYPPPPPPGYNAYQPPAPPPGYGQYQPSGPPRGLTPYQPPAPISAAPVTLPPDRGTLVRESTPPRPSAGGDFWVQVAASRTRVAALAAGRRIVGAHSDILGNSELTVVRSNVRNHGVYFRSRVGPYATSFAAHGVCNKLKKRRLDCFVASP